MIKATNNENMKDWSWKDEPELIEKLQQIQNSGGKYNSIDIMTIVGFMTSRDELVSHININGGHVQ